MGRKKWIKSNKMNVTLAPVYVWMYCLKSFKDVKGRKSKYHYHHLIPVTNTAQILIRPMKS